ncbi:methanogenesis marker 9 domain-containing protein [Methanospirillum stamsii]|uniref:Methanogenesis marker 9 domain-containing protein n=1 Tax=Methanospirillum stamsii TaxID=1277351 RepID=A0A2V2NCS2_9EURY|nr:methanogenesis marker 9 domain-containing protein [Methanospirillum stamsii]PWR73103.1 methanogenesis marker 9 domain-containing protein [Methanospirillum stamsii]
METDFKISIGDKSIKSPVAIACMAGITDGAYIRDRSDYIGLGIIGGYAIDKKTLNAAKIISDQGRDEFLPRNLIENLKEQIALIQGTGVVPVINLRASEAASLASLAQELGNSVIYEIDAHCRQQPMIEANSGEYLLHHPEILIAYVQTLKIAGVIVSVKIRAGIAADDIELSRLLWKAGADILHIDLMDFGHQYLKKIRDATPIFIIANNEINSYEKAKEMFAHGADMVSLARKSDPATLSSLVTSMEQYTKEHGWYNAPKQLCRGGDIRSLAFCCMPVKPCPLLPTLEKYKISPQEFVNMKMEAVAGTPLEQGANTCFGSLAYCCKDSTPCMFRDAALKQAGVKKSTYMDLKREISQKLLKKIFK